ncbi:MAG: hypothetical protein PWP65_282 [Clostridia bacterium]|nr:hypothetical protein [Clostridia bacterium]
MRPYLTVAQEARIEQKLKRSRFIGQVKEVTSEEEARAFIARVQAEHRQATHNCYAYRIGSGKNEIIYYSDAGEPHGTAGRPILGAILSAGVTDVVVVVTRYFGGQKLGVRGLIEAYGGTAQAVLAAAGIKEKVPVRTLKLRCSYEQLDRVKGLLRQYGGKIIAGDYGVSATLEIEVPLESLPALTAALGAIGIISGQIDAGR